MRRPTIAVLLTTALLPTLPAAAGASGTPSVGRAEKFFKSELRQEYREELKGGRTVLIECRQVKKFKTERRYRCEAMVETGDDDTIYPSAIVYWYKSEPWDISWDV